MRVRLTRGALGDLEAIRRYLVRQAGTAIAAKTIRRLRDDILALATMPERGNTPPEIAALGIRRYRELHVPPYRIIHHALPPDVIVDLVADARRDFRTLLEQRLLERE